MARWYKQRTNAGYEIQYYDDIGNAKCVCGCETLEELGVCLAATCNGRLKGNFPTVWLDGCRLIGKRSNEIRRTSAHDEIARLRKIVRAIKQYIADDLDDYDIDELDTALAFLVSLSRHHEEIDRLLAND